MMLGIDCVRDSRAQPTGRVEPDVSVSCVPHSQCGASLPLGGNAGLVLPRDQAAADGERLTTPR